MYMYACVTTNMNKVWNPSKSATDTIKQKFATEVL